ncbi:MAG TPA: hypothetical protein VHB46_03975 [Burkholderiales bacterium]|nr:hypothetical protein [Burkholderiales bacterium]
MGNLTEWSNVEQAAGAPLLHFADPQAEFEAVRSGAVVTPAMQYRFLWIHGDDAVAFLQGQLTCDVERVGTAQAQWGGYCTPKGRLIANFLLLAVPQGFLVWLPADVAASFAERLRKFILRSKVRIELESGWRSIGVAGPQACAVLERKFPAVPSTSLAVVRHANVQVVRLRGNASLVLAPAEEIGAAWTALAELATPAGDACWNWEQIHSGTPWVTAATQDQFLPQMIGLDEIDGVAFDKGCYAGQEIVARARYLGDVKRRLRHGFAAGSVRAGEALSSSAGPGGGVVLNAVGLPDGRSEFLAVVMDEAADKPLRSPGGLAVTLSPPSTIAG